jgi:hypothetical protein
VRVAGADQPGATLTMRPSPIGERSRLPKQIAGIPIPGSTLAVEATELVRDAGSDLLFDWER